MKKIILLLLSFSSFATFASTPTTQKVNSYNFQFKIPKSKSSFLKQKEFSISKQATSKELAFKAAASECFKKLTNNQYPGEEKGLDIIDICANPKM